jgi:hypothetical protein
MVSNRLNYYLNAKIPEVKFDWDVLELEAQNTELFPGQKL